MRKRLEFLMLLFLFSSILVTAGCFGGSSDSDDAVSGTYDASSVETISQDTTDEATEEVSLVSAKVVGEVEGVSAASVRLVVDKNDNGIFSEDDGDIVYASVTDDNGFFAFTDVKIPDSGVNATLTVSKDGYADFTKVLNLMPDRSSITMRISLVPATTTVIPITTDVRTTGKITIAVSKDGNVKTFIGTTRAPLDLNGTDITVSFDTSLLPSDVTAIKSSLKNFDSTNESDIKYFPGEFAGEDPNGNGEVLLDSVVFSLVDIENQNGEPLRFISTREDTCNVEITRYLSGSAIKKIKERGDFEPDTPGCQVPIYTYIPQTGKWDYLGVGTVIDSGWNEVGTCDVDESGYYYLKICAENPAVTNYYNLDYPVYFYEIKEVKVCFVTKGTNGEPVTDGWVSFTDVGIYRYAYSDSNGVAAISIPVQTSDGNVTTDTLQAAYPGGEFYYRNYILGAYYSADIAEIAESKREGCDFEIVRTVPNSPVEVTVYAKDENGNPVSDRNVCLTDNYYFYNCNKTDSNGVTTFSVKPEREYTAYGEHLERVSQRVTVSNPQSLVFTLEHKNNPPDVYLYVYPDSVKTGGVVSIYFSAYDNDWDDLNATLKCDGQEVTSFDYLYSYSGYLYGYATCTFEDSGDKKISVSVSDGYDIANREETVSVEEVNTPPIIYGYQFTDENGGKVSADAIKVNRTYTARIFAYDPDGDSLAYEETTGFCTNTGDGEFSCNFTSPGNFSLKFTVSDEKGGMDSVDIDIQVSENKPPRIVSSSVDKLEIESGDTVSVYAYVEDLDSQELSMELKVGNTTASGVCSQVSSGYFSCNGSIAVSGEEGETSIEITVKDNDDLTDTSNLAVVVGTINVPPVIVSGLPENIQLSPGDTYTFSVTAIDPDGDSLSYKWYVNGELQEEAGRIFSYQFNEAGTYTVKLEVSDGKSKVDSICGVSVTDGSDKITINVGLAGVYVSLLDSNMTVIKTVETDGSGIAVFDGVGSTASISITLSPDVVLTEGYVFDVFVDKLYEYLFNSFNGTLSSYGIDQWVLERKFPVSFFEDIGYFDSISPSLLDTDRDGYLSMAEIYDFVLQTYDDNGDGEVELKELVSDKVYVQVDVLKDLPSGTYDLSGFYLEDMGIGYELGYNFGYDVGYGMKFVNLTVTDVADYSNLNIYPVYPASHIFSNVTNSTYQMLVSVPLQNDGNYSLFLVASLFDNTTWSYYSKYYFFKDRSDDNLSVSLNDFVDGVRISTNIISNDTIWENVDIDVIYKGVMYSYLEAYLNIDGEYTIYTIPQIEGAEYYMDFNRGEITANSSFLYRSVRNIDLGASLPSFMDVSPYRTRLMDVYLSLDNETLILTGNDTSSVDLVIHNRVIAGTVNETYYQCEMTFISPYKGDNRITIPSVAEVIPSDVYTSYVKTVEENPGALRSYTGALDMEGFVWGDFSIFDDETREIRETEMSQSEWIDYTADTRVVTDRNMPLSQNATEGHFIGGFFEKIDVNLFK
ncbi:PKD domain-containing protein [Desulfurobacterium atlanticum]|uniref:PKD domain-containing protein n=1 Tax=Desulfurobacterium atlanticum TaxID=240169 RepID=A0A238ZD60_9BACT|nr:PKD domain-containing protein [Desulfurobacterium atlanticum]SNR80644.1 PKD domain-containing protein [Desulfurobacterium atlanticum]